MEDDDHPLKAQLLNPSSHSPQESSSDPSQEDSSQRSNSEASAQAPEKENSEGGIQNKIQSENEFLQATFFAEELEGENSDSCPEGKLLDLTTPRPDHAHSYERVGALIEELQEGEAHSQRDNSDKKAFQSILALGSFSFLKQKLLVWSKQASKGRMARLMSLMKSLNSAMTQMDRSLMKANLHSKRANLHLAPLLKRLIQAPEEMASLEKEQEAILKIFIRLDLNKQYKKDKETLESLVSRVKRKASDFDLERFARVTALIDDSLEASKKALDQDVDAAKEALVASGISPLECEKALRLELLNRHDKKETNAILASLKYELPQEYSKKLQNQSSAKSTPIDGKRSTSDNSVANLTSLKKRDFQEFKQDSKRASAKSSPGKSKKSSKKSSPRKNQVDSDDDEPKVVKLQKVEETLSDKAESSDDDKSMKSEDSPDEEKAGKESQLDSEEGDLKDKLDLDSNNEFSFNNGGIEGAQHSQKQSQKQSQKLSQKSSKKGGKTLRVKKTLSQGSADAKSNGSAKKPRTGSKLLEEDEIIQAAKPQSQQNSEVELELDSDKMSLEKRDQNGDGPSWNKSYYSNNMSQISNRSNIDELKQQFAMRRRTTRGRNFISRSSTIMNMPSQQQSQSTSRPTSQVNSRLNSARGTPRSKAMPVKNRLMTDFMGGQRQIRKYDTPRAPYPSAGASAMIYQQLKAENEMNIQKRATYQQQSPPKRIAAQNPAGFRAPMRKLGGQIPAKRVAPSPVVKQQVMAVPRQIVARPIQRQGSPQKQIIQQAPRPQGQRSSPQKVVQQNFRAPMVRQPRMMSERTQQQMQKQAMAMGGKQSVTPKKLAQLMATTPQAGKSSVRQSSLEQRFNCPEDLF